MISVSPLLRAVIVPAAGFHPQLLGLDGGHQDFLGARRVHLLADDLLDFAQDHLAKREERVHAGSRLADHAGANEQAVARDVGIDRIFFQGGHVQLAQRYNSGHSSLHLNNNQAGASRWL